MRVRISTVFQELNRLQAAGREGQLAQADLKDGTFTLSNIGIVGTLTASWLLRDLYCFMQCVFFSACVMACVGLLVRYGGGVVARSEAVFEEYSINSVAIVFHPVLRLTSGGTYASPVVSLPEVAIGAIGKIQRVPRFGDNDEVVPVNIMNISWIITI